MIRVNLLPWREARRKANNLQFFILMGMVAGLAASIVLLVHGYYATRISTQTEAVVRSTYRISGPSTSGPDVTGHFYRCAPR